MTIDTKPIAELIDIVKLKYQLDKNRNWSNDSSNYLEEIKKELDEVKAEVIADRPCYLEDELGDVLWDYLNLLNSLEAEGKIQLGSVFNRAKNKYQERVNAIKSGENWSDIKRSQKQRLAKEQATEL